MNFIGKLLLIVLVTIVSYVTYAVFFFSPEILERFENATSIKTVSELTNKLPLREYCIKSSRNTTLTEKNSIDVKNIKLILGKGCRFLDFEIFLIDNGAYVASSTDSSFSTITSTNYVSLNEVLKHVVMHGFSAPSPNSNDPLFINFRIKTKSTKLYNMIGMAVGKYL